MKFENLEFLIVLNESYDFKKALDDDFLESFPNLKFFYFKYVGLFIYPSLAEQKRSLNDRKCLYYHYNDSYEYSENFDYANWPKYVEHRGQLGHFPHDLYADNFNKLVDCRIPFHYFTENFLSLCVLEVGRVLKVNERLLVQFLKGISLFNLGLRNEFNLGQEFFDEVADFLSVDCLSLYESTLSRLHDFAFPSKLNFTGFGFYYDRVHPREAILMTLKKPSCYHFDFIHSSQFFYRDREYKQHEDNTDDSDREIPQMRSKIVKRADHFYCTRCGWSSESDPNFSDAILDSVIDHVVEPK